MTIAAGNRLARRSAGRFTASTNPRTFQPVHRSSHHLGERERGWWAPVDPLQLRAIVEAAKLQEVATKAPGKRNGDLGATSIRILEFLVSNIDWATGALEPAYTYIKIKTGLSIHAIAAALKRLRTAGFLEWMRRTVRVEEEGSDQYVRQIENAYRLTVPERWAKRIRMRVAQWREQAVRSKQAWGVRSAELAVRAGRSASAKLARTRAWIEETIASPELRATLIADAEERYAIQPG